MTREYWLNYIKIDPLYSTEAIILDIYDDFEQQVCKNCKYGGNGRPRVNECPLDDYFISLDEYDESTFGCTYFEKGKTNE